MARDSLKVYSTFARTTGRSIGFQQTGVLLLARSDEDIALVRRNVAMMAELGIDTHCLDADEIRLLVPGLEVEDDTVGAWEPDGGVVDPVKTVEGLAELAKSHGATTRVGLGADGLRVIDGAVAGVETADGPVPRTRRDRASVPGRSPRATLPGDAGSSAGQGRDAGALLVADRSRYR
jgi:glycine/D-amino acid oxidase-like deaminating enzyme